MSPSTEVQHAAENVAHAKKALGARMRDLRKQAGLTARGLAAGAGWHESKCSRIQSGTTTPSDHDIRVWAYLCGAEDQITDLIAAARMVEGMYVEWKRLERSGIEHVQESVRPLFDRTCRFRFYQSWVVPGLLQTEDYTRAVLRTVVSLRDAPGEIEEAVAIRMDRQKVLQSGRQSFAMLIEEWVLHTVMGDREVLAGQLDRLLTNAFQPAVSFGVIPMRRPRGVGWPAESFTIYDEDQVAVELVSGSLTVTQPSEVKDYVTTYAELSRLAVVGSQARELIIAAIKALG